MEKITRQSIAQKIENDWVHGPQTPNEGIDQRNLKNWVDVADKICFGRT